MSTILKVGQVWEVHTSVNKTKIHMGIRVELVAMDERRKRADVKYLNGTGYGSWLHTTILGYCSLVSAVGINATNDLQTTKEEETMSEKVKNIEVRTYINGNNAVGMSDASIFSYLKELEKEVDKLEAVKTKPKKLQAEIDGIKEDIKAIVEYVDTRDES